MIGASKWVGSGRNPTGRRDVGYPLAREGMKPNHNKLRRIYREEDLRVRRRAGP